MVKASRSGSPKAGSQETRADGKARSQSKVQPAATPTTGAADPKKNRPSSKSHQPKVGGTAVTGAKSTQPKELSTGTPPDQQPEYYNRDTRRRMQQMGTGPYSQNPALDARSRSKKRKERLKARQEEVKHLVDAKGPSRDIRLGRRNTYFLIGIVTFVVILLVIFIILRHPF